jgi:hypothetical protein
MRRISLLLVFVLFLVGCAGNVQWRESSDTVSPPPSDSSKAPYLDVEHYQTTQQNEPGVVRSTADKTVKRRHTIAYIEFDEQGDYLDRNELVDAIRNIPVGANRLIVFYAHGWENNTRSADVAQFNALLAHLAHTLNEKSEKQGRGTPWEVYGIYLGWRGTLYDPSDIYPAQPAYQLTSIDDILKKPQPSTFNTLASVPKQFTFWSRKDAAGRFAGAPLLEAINMISARARTKPGAPGLPLETKTILIGHSFGAFVIEKTVLQAISTSSPQMASDQTMFITPPADLIILLNSAAPAIYAKEFIEFLKWHSVGRDQKPFVISVSSEGDWATKDLFPVGTVLASAFDVGSYQGKNTYHGANEKTFFTHTPGHTEYLPSFDAYPTGQVPSDRFSSDYENEWIFYRNLFPTDFAKTDLRFLAWGGSLAKTNEPAPAQIWELKPTKPVDPKGVPFNDTPYWLVRVPTSIIADHGDVWCPNSMNLLTALIRLSGIADSTNQLRTIKLLPEKAPAHDELVPLLDYGKDN